MVRYACLIELALGETLRSLSLFRFGKPLGEHLVPIVHLYSRARFFDAIFILPIENFDLLFFVPASIFLLIIALPFKPFVFAFRAARKQKNAPNPLIAL